MSSTTAEWLLEIGALTVGEPTVTTAEQGRDLARQLSRAAAGHASASSCAAGCGCPLATLEGGPALCAFADSLAGSTAGSSDPADATAAGTDELRAARAYLQALRAASTAVFHCRRQAHAVGECWFRDVSSTDCGAVLALAHRLGV